MGKNNQRTERLEREQREQARQERHAARALAAAGLQAIEEAGEGGVNGTADPAAFIAGDPNTSPSHHPCPSDPGENELTDGNIQQLENSTVISNAELADLLIEVRLTLRRGCCPPPKKPNHHQSFF